MKKILCVLIMVLMVQWMGSASALAEESPEIHPKIISLYAAHTEILLRLGARDHLVGISAHETYDGPETQGWERPPVFSLQDDVEKFLMAKPDIILLRPFHVAAGSRLVETLAATGIKLEPLQVLHPEDLYQYWRTLAKIVGREVAGEKMILEFDQAISAYRQAVAQKPEEDKPGIFLEAIHKQVRTFTEDSLPYWIVQLAGGRNVALGTRPRAKGQIIADYGPERLLTRADQIDIFISQQGLMNMTPLDQIIARNIYQPLRAIQQGKVYKIPEKYLARPTPSLLVGLKVIADITGLEMSTPAQQLPDDLSRPAAKVSIKAGNVAEPETPTMAEIPGQEGSAELNVGMSPAD